MKASAGGLVLLHAAECRLGLVDVLAGCIREQCAAERLVHTLLAALHSCMFLIACGAACPRGGEADPGDSRRRLRGSGTDSLLNLAVGRARESGRDLCSRPATSRLENAPWRSEGGCMTVALVDVLCRSFPIPRVFVRRVIRY